MTVVVLAFGAMLALGACGPQTEPTSAATPAATDATGAAEGTAAPSPASSGAAGAKPAGQCDPNYSGACVPIASDVDCAGGSGNGPAYVQGPVRVVGTDIYRLDRDGDGTACD